MAHVNYHIKYMPCCQITLGKSTFLFLFLSYTVILILYYVKFAKPTVIKEGKLKDFSIFRINKTIIIIQ